MTDGKKGGQDEGGRDDSARTRESACGLKDDSFELQERERKLREVEEEDGAGIERLTGDDQKGS